MKLLAFSCHNIWPFFDRTMSVVFQDGKYLVKAPIGSGKSFLFFDGPIFGLYKYTNRPMLSVRAENGYAKILFEHNDKILVCHRDIARTKTWNDTIKSSLYTIETPLLTVENILQTHSIVSLNEDLVDQILKQSKHERIECKNETDVQETLNSFLPPQEVFLSTSMLLQDSENVFELAPADRISLFKEIFGLLSIDSATDKINDERKAVAALLKSKKITDDVDKKLRQYLLDLTTNATSIKTLDSRFAWLLSDEDLVQDKITITWYALDQWWIDTILSVNQTLTKEYNEKQQLLGAADAEQNILKTLEKDIRTTQQTIEDSSEALLALEKQSQSFNQNDITWLADQKKSVQNTYQTWIAWLSSSRFTSPERSFSQLWDNAQEHIQQGKILIEQQMFIKQRVDELKQRKIDDASTLESYDTQINQLQTDYESKKKFTCELIWDDCPFIEQINEWFFKTFKNNIIKVEATRNAFKEKVDATSSDARIAEEEKKLQDTENKINTMKEHVFYTDYKTIKEAKTTHDEYNRNMEELQRRESALASQMKELDTIRTKSIQLEEKKKNATDQLIDLQKKYADAKEKTHSINTDQLTQSIRNIESSMSILSRMNQAIDRIQDLISTHKDSQRAIKNLEEREQLLTDLYRIFSKEIMIKVLEDALPFFAEYVNNLLAKMVPFTIHFQPKKTASDKLELDITIRDALWERNVRSLSGWQKAILRLAWILWVAQMTRIKQLFLDETINNIDQETISQVAEMLQDYTKTNDISLYLVTHSAQLQNMPIWDETIQLASIKSDFKDD